MGGSRYSDHHYVSRAADKAMVSEDGAGCSVLIEDGSLKEPAALAAE